MQDFHAQYMYKSFLQVMLELAQFPVIVLGVCFADPKTPCHSLVIWDGGSQLWTRAKIMHAKSELLRKIGLFFLQMVSLYKVSG